MHCLQLGVLFTFVIHVEVVIMTYEQDKSQDKNLNYH